MMEIILNIISIYNNACPIYYYNYGLWFNTKTRDDGGEYYVQYRTKITMMTLKLRHSDYYFKTLTNSYNLIKIRLRTQSSRNAPIVVKSELIKNAWRCIRWAMSAGV